MKKTNVQKIVGLAILSAIVIVLQLIGSYIKVGPVSISLVLIPIVIGAAVYGRMAGAYLGLVFSIVVLLQPDTQFFYNMSIVGTILIVLIKGIGSGLVSGIVYKLFSKKNQYVSVLLSAIVCPLVNTGIFSLGCRLFFWDELATYAVGSGSSSTIIYFISVFIGFNFLVELGVNIICAPVILRILRAAKIK